MQVILIGSEEVLHRVNGGERHRISKEHRWLPRLIGDAQTEHKRGVSRSWMCLQRDRKD